MCGRARANPRTARVRRGASASSSRRMRAAPGRMWDSRTRATSAGSRSTHVIPMSSTWGRWATCGARTRNAACSRRPMAGRRGRTSSTSTSIPASSTSSWTTTTRTRSSPRPTSGSAPASASRRAAAGRACGARRTAGRAGRGSRRGCRRANWAASGSTSTGGTGTSCTRSWRRTRARACTDPPTAARRGSS